MRLPIGQLILTIPRQLLLGQIAGLQPSVYVWCALTEFFFAHPVSQCQVESSQILHLLVGDQLLTPGLGRRQGFHGLHELVGKGAYRPGQDANA